MYGGAFSISPCKLLKQLLQGQPKEKPRTPGSGRDDGAQKHLRNKKLRNEHSFQSSHPHTRGYTPPARFVFFHPDYTVGFGIAPNHALRLVGYTTGRESHPALKTVSTCLRCDDSTSRRQMQYPSAKKDKTGTLRERESRYGKDRRNLRRSLQLIALNLRTSALPRPPPRREPRVLPLRVRERLLRR